MKPAPRALLALISLALITSTAIAQQLPPGEAQAKATVEKSPRHGEYVDIKVEGMQTPLKAYVVYPERKEKAGVVIVIHEIFGLSDWIRGVTDQLAADGFIAIAPDFLSGKGANGGGTETFADRNAVTGAVRGLNADAVNKMLDATMRYGEKLPASNGKTGVVGFCWGGGKSFEYAVAQPELDAAVVYYGTNPSDPAAINKIKAPVLGLYGADDARVNSTIDAAAKAMKAAGKSYQYHIYDGAGHGFLRQQDGRDGANMKATQQAWPATIQFFREHLK